MSFNLKEARRMYKPDEALKQSIDQWIEANQNDFVRDLAKLVAIPSISVENDGIKQQRLPENMDLR